jgi:hypothetical protein
MWSRTSVAQFQPQVSPFCQVILPKGHTVTVVASTLFPLLKRMVASLGTESVRVGWYGFYAFQRRL